MTKPKNKSTILVLTSTLPRWKGDNTSPFVEELCIEIDKKNRYQQYVLAPHSKGADLHSSLGSNIEVRRVIYGFPLSQQKVFYEGGAASKKKGLLFYLFSLTYIVTLFLYGLWFAVSKKVTVIHAHWAIPQGVVAILIGKITNKPVLVTVHGSDIFTMQGSFATKLKKFVLKHANTVTYNSSIVKEACMQLVSNRSYEFGPMGVSTDHFKITTKKSRKKSDTKKLLFVGRVSEEKGLQYLVESLKDIEGDFTLDIVGDGPYMKQLKDLQSNSPYTDKIKLHGWVDKKELAAFYKNADLFVGPSITMKNGSREAMGIVYLEALMSGVPVITTNNAGSKDFIEEGVNGASVEEKSPKAIASAINALLAKDINIDLFQKKLQDIKNTYSWDACSRRYLVILEKLSN